MPDWLFRLLLAAIIALAILGALGWAAYRDVAVRALIERVEDLSWRRRAGVALAVARDPRVRWWVRAIPVLTALYLASPLDIIPDFIPVIGQLDDLLIIGIALWLMLRAIPAEVVEAHIRTAEAAEAPANGPQTS